MSLIVLVLAQLTACSLPARADDDANRPESIETRPGDEDFDDQPGQTVYQVLLAEIALQRGNPELAAQSYADLAMRTRDPKVLERTVEVAGYAHDFDLALKAVRTWLEVEPESIRAQQMLVSVMVLSNQLGDVAPSLVRLLQTDQAALPANLLGLNRMFARNPDRLAVFVLLEKVCRPFFDLPEAHYTVAMAASSAGITERALAEVRRALELRPDWEMAALLQAQILGQASPADAIAFLQDFVERHPQAREVKLHLARALIGEKRYAEAKAYFDQLLEDYPDRPEVVYPAAMLALQQNDKAYAETQLKHLLTLDLPDKDIAYYYLGQIAEEDQRGDEALDYYARVGGGEQYLMARMRSARVLANQGKLEEGRQLLTSTQT
ncbi:MAG: tetratricopeptide repeat protein, partial [Propionivibrio sp.]